MNAAMHDETETLKNGTKVCVRCIRPEDKNRVSEVFKKLTPESIFLRFFHEKIKETGACSHLRIITCRIVKKKARV